MLRLKGYFPGQSARIDFEMLYQAVDGRWRLFGLAVQPGPPTPAPAPAANASEPASSAAKKK
jgi:hypothetical protein